MKAPSQRAFQWAIRSGSHSKGTSRREAVAVHVLTSRTCSQLLFLKSLKSFENLIMLEKHINTELFKFAQTISHPAHCRSAHKAIGWMYANAADAYELHIMNYILCDLNWDFEIEGQVALAEEDRHGQRFWLQRTFEEFWVKTYESKATWNKLLGLLATWMVSLWPSP